MIRIDSTYFTGYSLSGHGRISRLFIAAKCRCFHNRSTPVMMQGSPLDVSQSTNYVLQLCHGYDMPFHDVARQYAALFKDTSYKLVTVFLTGRQNDDIARQVESDEVIFLENSSKDIRGLKRKQIRQVWQLHKKYSFTFCIAHRFKPIYIACHIDDLFVIGVHHAFGGYSRWTRRWFVNRKCNRLALLGVSDAVRDDIRKRLPKFSETQIATLYNRINYREKAATLFSREEAREKLGLPESAYVFGNVGRLHPDKDQSTLIKAFATVYENKPEAILVIMGKGRQEGELRTLCVELGVDKRVIFTGAVENASRYFKAFDCFTLSSDHEPFGMVLLEAMIAGIPMVVCNSGGAPEVCGDLGQLFSLHDDAEMAKQMMLVMTFDEQHKAALQEQMMQRIDALFSDDSVMRVFWGLPFVTKR